MRAACACLERLVEGEESGWRGHVAEVAQDRPRIGEIVAPELKQALHRLEHLGAAGMEQKAVELTEAHAARVEKRLHGGLEMVAQEKRQVRTQHHAESVMPDVPAHD